MAQVIMAALDRWLANLPPALVPCLPSGLDESNQLLHRLINKAFNKQTDIGWVISYEAVCRSTGKGVSQSTTSTDNRAIPTIRLYG
jgi:hypothetical protein